MSKARTRQGATPRRGTSATPRILLWGPPIVTFGLGLWLGHTRPLVFSDPVPQGACPEVVASAPIRAPQIDAPLPGRELPDAPSTTPPSDPVAPRLPGERAALPHPEASAPEEPVTRTLYRQPPASDDRVQAPEQVASEPRTLERRVDGRDGPSAGPGPSSREGASSPERGSTDRTLALGSDTARGAAGAGGGQEARGAAAPPRQAPAADVPPLPFPTLAPGDAATEDDAPRRVLRRAGALASAEVVETPDLGEAQASVTRLRDAGMDAGVVTRIDPSGQRRHVVVVRGEGEVEALRGRARALLAPGL